MACLTSFTLIVLTSIFHSANSFHEIPALIWCPERSLSHLPEVTGVDPIKTDDFLNAYLTPLMDSSSESFVVFVQDKLHMDDFTQYADVYSLDSDGGAFKHIKGLMEDHFSLELPQVTNPFDAVEKLKTSFSGKVHTVKSAEEVEGLNLSKDKKILLIVELNPISGQKDQENAIRQNDATVGAITQHLQKRSIKYSALFTGQSASDKQADNVQSHSNRRLLATSTYNGTFLNASDGQIYIFIREALLVMKLDNRNITVNLTVDADTAKNSSRDNKTAEIRLDFVNAPYNETSYNISIVTEAHHLGDRWKMSRVYLNLVGGIEPHSNFSLYNVTLSTSDMDLTIPILYSWHCTDMQLFVDTVYNKELKHLDGSYVRLTGYQVQAFRIEKDRFFDAQDCVGYFTTAIWMFLFSAIFLLSILIFGVLMVLSLSTMDKYDDPKGKTISVAQGTD